MKWWHRRKAEVEVDMSEADDALRDAHATTARVDRLARTVLPGLRTLEAHREDNHILDAMLGTLGRRT